MGHEIDWLIQTRHEIQLDVLNNWLMLRLDHGSVSATFALSVEQAKELSQKLRSAAEILEKEMANPLGSTRKSYIRS